MAVMRECFINLLLLGKPYVLEGSVVMQVRGGKAVTLGPGITMAASLPSA
jgi:hypothetical protein